MWGAAINAAVKKLAALQFPIADAAPANWVADEAIAHLQPLGWRQRVQRFVSQREQVVTRFSRRAANGDATAFQRAAAGCAAFVWAARGIGADHINPRQRHIQFLGGDLRQRRGDALPQLDLAAENSDAPGWLNTQPVVQLRVCQKRGRAVCAAFPKWRAGKHFNAGRLETPCAQFYGAADAVIHATATQITSQGAADSGIGRITNAVEQALRRDDHACAAKSTLGSLLF